MKKIIAILLCTALFLGLTACGGNRFTLSPSTPAPSVSITDPATTLSVGQTVSLSDQCEFTLDYITLTQEVKPPYPGSFYSYYTAEEGYSYIDLCIAYKNLKTSAVMADDLMRATAYYSGTYQYTGFTVAEKDNRSDLTYANITSISPLATEYLHYLLKIPQEAAAGAGSLVVILRIGGTDYKIPLRDGAEGLTVTPNADSAGKTSGSILVDEKIAIPGKSEFFIEYARFSKKVTPVVPDDWYTYYEADDGKVYLDLCVAYKNLQSVAVKADKVLSGTLKFAGKYEYTGFAMVEEPGRGDFTYANITSISPLETGYVHYLIEVPEEVQSSSGALELTLRIDGSTYQLKLR